MSLAYFQALPTVNCLGDFSFPELSVPPSAWGMQRSPSRLLMVTGQDSSLA